MLVPITSTSTVRYASYGKVLWWDVTRVFFLFQDRDEQKRLEMKHRKEEDDLYRKFARQREEEERRIRDEIRVSFNFKCQIFQYNNKCSVLAYYLQKRKKRLNFTTVLDLKITGQWLGITIL